MRGGVVEDAEAILAHQVLTAAWQEHVDVIHESVRHLLRQHNDQNEYHQAMMAWFGNSKRGRLHCTYSILSRLTAY